MVKSAPLQCIYCKRSNVPLNREHVIPEAFGSYGSETMVLSDNAVCEDCNSHLGAEIDQILNRDSYEALVRANSMTRGQGSRERFPLGNSQCSFQMRRCSEFYEVQE